jgi:hypothetical protein
MAKQDGASSRVALEQERKKVRYLAGEEIVSSGSCVPKSPIHFTCSHPVRLRFILIFPWPPKKFPILHSLKYLQVCCMSGLSYPPFFIDV